MEKYTMDPETDDLIYAAEFRSGMRVFPENPEHMGIENWVEVSNVVATPHDTLRFIAINPDGTKFSVTCGLSMCWFVKKDSVPPNPFEALRNHPFLGPIFFGKEKTEEAHAPATPKGETAGEFLNRKTEFPEKSPFSKGDASFGTVTPVTEE